MNERTTNLEPSGRHFFRRVLFILACLATLLALGYTAAKAHGKRVWENCRQELEAKGASLDWAAYIPPPVPDEQNIFKAPKMAEWFVRNSSGIGQFQGPASTGPLPPISGLPYGNTNTILIAELKVSLPVSAEASAKSNTVWQLDSSEARADADKLLRDVLGQTAPGMQGPFIFLSRSLDQTKATHISLRADAPPTAETIRELFPSDKTLPRTSRLRTESSGSNSFRVLLSPPVWIAAGDYVAWTDQSAPNLDLIRSALKRPYARMDGDYQRPFAMPIPNFITVRHVAQALAQRTECYLLIGQPEDALRELTLLHDLGRLLKAEPTGKPMSLVSAMIHVAISGLHAATIAEGLRLQGWRDPQLAAIQQQLKETNLLPSFIQAFETERAGFCRTLESFGTGELFNLFSPGRMNYSVWDKIKNPRFLISESMPRGWVYQNMATIALVDQKAIESVDLSNRRVLSIRADAFAREVENSFKHFSPYRVLASIAIPNSIKATQALARNQTWVNQAFIACALERFHQAHGKYPENLDALVPQYASTLPRDIINGQSFKYRPTAAGGFALYSVGWNEKDDGGVAATNPSPSEGDWLWATAKL